MTFEDAASIVGMDRPLTVDTHDRAKDRVAPFDPRPLVFEPHNGFGSKAPDGEPWPLGYISIDYPRTPLFELTPIVGRPTEELVGYAALLAAAPDLLEALRNLVAHIDEKFHEQEIHKMFLGDWNAARAAIAKATPPHSEGGASQ